MHSLGRYARTALHSASSPAKVTQQSVKQSLTQRKYSVKADEKQPLVTLAKRFLHSVNHESLIPEMPKSVLERMGACILETEEKFVQIKAVQKLKNPDIQIAAQTSIEENSEEIARLTNLEIARQTSLKVGVAKVVESLHQFTALPEGNDLPSQSAKKSAACRVMIDLADLAKLQGIDLSELVKTDRKGNDETLFSDPVSFSKKIVHHVFSELGSHITDPKVLGSKFAVDLVSLLKYLAAAFVTVTVYELFEKAHAQAIKEVESLKSTGLNVYEHDRAISRENLNTSLQVELHLTGDLRTHFEGVRRSYHDQADALMTGFQRSLSSIDLSTVNSRNKQEIIESLNKSGKEYAESMQKLTQDFVDTIRIFRMKVETDKQLKELSHATLSPKLKRELQNVRGAMHGVDMINGNKDELFVLLKKASSYLTGIETAYQKHQASDKGFLQRMFGES
jgi:hypothetical protein